MTDGPPAAWYPDPDNAGLERFWAGRDWTDATRPRRPSPTLDRPEAIDIVFTAAMPIYGLIVGSVYTIRGRGRAGLLLLAVTTVTMLLWALVIATVLR